MMSCLQLRDSCLMTTHAKQLSCLQGEQAKTMLAVHENYSCKVPLCSTPCYGLPLRARAQLTASRLQPKLTHQRHV
jgi:hypothetical protein